MATIFRKSYTQHLPQHCEIVERRGKPMARWTDQRGNVHHDEITTGRKGETKIVRYSPTWIARYRDAEGVERFKSTNCRDEQAARQVLANIVRRVEHIKAGIITPEQDRQSHHADRTIHEHIADYLVHLKVKTIRGKRISAHHQRNVKHQLERIVKEARLRRLGDISRDVMERWMKAREDEGLGGRTRNTYRSALVAFCNWCVDSDRLSINPLARFSKAEERSDRRRTRRALAEEEIDRLLKTARLRPVAEYGRRVVAKPAEQRKGRATWTRAPLTFAELDQAYQRGRERLGGRHLTKREFLGRQRTLMYRIMICTGLRKSELASLTAGQVYLDAKFPYVEVLAQHEKAGRGASIPLRADLVEQLRTYLDDIKRRKGDKVPLGTQLFPMPADMIRVFDRDLAVAEIPKRDERNRVVDIHALRHTFGTHLARAGVSPRVAMAAMRHSSLELTMNVYTDPALLDVTGAVESLPAFGGKSDSHQNELPRTG